MLRHAPKCNPTLNPIGQSTDYLTSSRHIPYHILNNMRVLPSQLRLPIPVHLLSSPTPGLLPLNIPASLEEHSPSSKPLPYLSSGKASRYRRTLPASLSASSEWNLVRFELAGKIQSGTSLIKKPFMPLPAASIAAYSSLRVESDVQYCTVAGGCLGASATVSGWGWGSVRVGN